MIMKIKEKDYIKYWIIVLTEFYGFEFKYDDFNKKQNTKCADVLNIFIVTYVSMLLASCSQLVQLLSTEIQNQSNQNAFVSSLEYMF